MSNCRLCGTPDIKISTDGHQVCSGCGVSCLHDIVLYWKREHKKIDFFTLTRKYRSSQSDMSLGSWMMARNFQMIAKP